MKATIEASLITALAEDGDSYRIQNVHSSMNAGYIDFDNTTVTFHEGETYEFILENNELIFINEFPESKVLE